MSSQKDKKEAGARIRQVNPVLLKEALSRLADTRPDVAYKALPGVMELLSASSPRRAEQLTMPPEEVSPV
jgi:hypothetical protein